MIARGPVREGREQLLHRTVERMLGMVNRARFVVSRSGTNQTITIAGTTIVIDPATFSFEHQLERLASAVEAVIAYDRVRIMLAAVGMERGPVPLWLVTGSRILAQWLVWSRSEMALRQVLRLSDQVDTAPVAGTLDRSARATLGLSAAKVVVANGLAVAKKIDLSGHGRCVLALGRTAELTVRAGKLTQKAAAVELPHTLVATMPGRRLSTVISHPFLAAADLVISGVRNDRQRLVVEVVHEQGPLVPVPEAALAGMPADADAKCPWRPTAREVAYLYALVDELRGHDPLA